MQLTLKDFQKQVIDEEGYVLSNGTLNLNDLLSKAYDFMNMFNLSQNNLIRNIPTVFEFTKDADDTLELTTLVYHDEARIPKDKEDDASYLWNEDIYNYFNEISPDGYYFGSSYGEGACVGWFKIEEEEN